MKKKDKKHQSFKPVHIISFVSYRLDHDECERAMLPTLEHASLVHSHIHHLTDQSDEAFAQTRNAIVYISVSTFILFIAEICTLHHFHLRPLCQSPATHFSLV